MLSTLAENTVPVKLKPALVLAVYDPAPENCDQIICVVPTTIGLLVVHTYPVSALVDPASTKVNAPAISVPTSKSVARVNMKGSDPEPTCVTV